MQVFSRFVIAVLIGAGFLVCPIGVFADEPKAQSGESSRQSLKLVLEEDGGFVYRHEKYTLNSVDLSSGNRSKLSEIIAKTGILERDSKKISGAADTITYIITVSGDRKKFHAEFDDATTSESYRALVDFIVKNGKRRTHADSQRKSE
jgi:hypothetical protein